MYKQIEYDERIEKYVLSKSGMNLGVQSTN